MIDINNASRRLQNRIFGTNFDNFPFQKVGFSCFVRVFNTVRSGEFPPTLFGSKLYKILFVQLSRFDDTVLEAQDVPDKSLPVSGSQDTSKMPHVRDFRSDASGSRNSDSAE